MAKIDFICCVVNMGVAPKVVKVAQKYGIKGVTIALGRGTVASRLLDILGLNEERKEILTMIVEDELADDALKGIGREMEFHKPNHGIAFSMSVSELISSKIRVESKAVSGEENESMYQIIYVIVDKGRAEEVIEAANKGGARGGTIINARSAGIHEAQKLFSVEIEPQKEEVFIIAKKEIKDRIVDSIKSHMNMDEPGHGIMFVLDVNEAYGLH